ncbi:dUTP diphosphatase [Macrococcoides caseolyticum]|uniref:dUTP diphosphatase n=1 Tax=Macrococcoides caseolyticum TaxID=69966 RepID=UPI000C340691|nr:dUTP diphosphatase [Macrococcus caseolyticus]PKE18672.1 hypothetical protein CW679_09715 [Macrococcus caseolyticus]PKF41678.1 hypothetical protein CW661_00650 [Macrococcus caseolyticus]
MIKMTTELFEKFSKKQEELDSMIREKFGISEVEWKNYLNIQHSIALRVELHELVNECHDLWKYWKQKAVNPDRIIDELVDVIHFLHLILNKADFNTEYHVREINKYIPTEEQVKDVTDYLGDVCKINYLIKSDELHKTYAHLLVLADHYAFTLDDIEQAYDRKNAENHARQNRNY